LKKFEVQAMQVDVPLLKVKLALQLHVNEPKVLIHVAEATGQLWMLSVHSLLSAHVTPLPV
jgi:hypothetical protein